MGKKLTTAGFVEAATKVHNSVYNYSKVQYKNAKTKVCITCPVHGDFEQTPDIHLRGSGCRKCFFDSVGDTLRKSVKQFVTESANKHGHKYCYKDVVHIDNKTLVIITCPVHGSFKQTPSQHSAGHGCKACGIERTTAAKKFTKSMFVMKAKLVHGDKYDYSKLRYKTSTTKVEIVCRTHGSFWQEANSHLQGKTCNSCTGRGFDSSKPATLYYLRVTARGRSTPLYKIGVTNNTVQQRFKTDMKYITILHEEYFNLGKAAYTNEQQILKQFEHYKYIGTDVLKSGNTELFTKDILNMDTTLNTHQIKLQQINVNVNKTQLMGIISDILASEDNSSLLRAIQPQLANKFPQFPEFTNVSITGINSDGSAAITLKQPVVRVTKQDEQSPSDLDIPVEETVAEPVDSVDMSAETFVD